MYDVIIIGAGVIGCSVARELSKYNLKVAVIEKNNDVGEGTSKANSGIVHAGFDAKVKSMKAKLNVEGNRMMEEIANELDIPFQRNGSLVLCFSEEDRGKLEELYQKGLQNNVPGLQILDKNQISEMEPNLAKEVVAALYAPTGGIVCPFTLTLAFAENAAVNGVEFMMEQEVITIDKRKNQESNYYSIHTNKGSFDTKLVVNAAGVYADVFHNMVSNNKIKIIPRKGEYCLFDKRVSNIVKSTIFQLPSAMGKGVLVTPTVHGNMMIGPSALDTEDKEMTNTTAQGLSEIMSKAKYSVLKLPFRNIITSFSGLRAHEQGDEFIIKEVEDSPGFIDAAGIESPGLTCSPMIGVYVSEIISGLIVTKEKENFISTRKGIHGLLELSDDEKRALTKENPAYANIICRCETVSEGEILDAIHRPLGAKTLDGVKRRTRAGMGRCQSGFCSTKVIEILARELQVDVKEVSKFGGDSKLIIGKNKEV
ncbi:MAG: NAD(P)/FAD-dependent oxidoreductase [Lachnotalea sp.]